MNKHDALIAVILNDCFGRSNDVWCAGAREAFGKAKEVGGTYF